MGQTNAQLAPPNPRRGDIDLSPRPLLGGDEPADLLQRRIKVERQRTGELSVYDARVHAVYVYAKAVPPEVPEPAVELVREVHVGQLGATARQGSIHLSLVRLFVTVSS